MPYFRLLMAVLLKHHDLGHVALGLIEHGLPEAGRKHGLPRSIAEVCKVVHQAKRSLIKVGNMIYLYFVTDIIYMCKNREKVTKRILIGLCCNLYGILHNYHQRLLQTDNSMTWISFPHMCNY